MRTTPGSLATQPVRSNVASQRSTKEADVQTGSVRRTGRGWRGYWREDGRRRATATYAKKGEARAALNRELDRVALGDAYMAPITVHELCDRFIAQYGAAPQTVKYAQRRLVRPLAALGDAQAGDVTTESLQRVLAAVPGKAYRRDIARTLRMVYRFGVEARLVRANPAVALRRRCSADPSGCFRSSRGRR